MNQGVDERAKTLRRMYKLRGAPLTEEEQKEVAQFTQPKLDTSMQEFAEFVKSLDGDEGQLNETSVTKMFMSGIYSQRLPTEPLRIVEMERVPAGLQRSRTIVRPPEYIPWDRVMTSKRGNPERRHYGAWYLPPAEWKAYNDQSRSLFQDNLELKRRTEVLRQEVSHLHGARLFRDYLVQQHAHIPRFLERSSVTPSDGQQRKKKQAAATSRPKSLS